MQILRSMLLSLTKGAPGEWYIFDDKNKINWHDQSQVKRRLYKSFNEAQQVYLTAMLNMPVTSATAMSGLMQLNYFNAIHRSLYLRYCTPPVIMSYQVRRFYVSVQNFGIWDKIFRYLTVYENTTRAGRDPIAQTSRPDTD